MLCGVHSSSARARDDVTDTNQICMTANIKLDKYYELEVGMPVKMFNASPDITRLWQTVLKYSLKKQCDGRISAL